MIEKNLGFSLTVGPQWKAELKRLNATTKEITRAIDDEILTTAVEIRNIIIRNMRKKKTGRFYKKTKKNILYQASAPWQAPAVDTGALIRSIVMDVRPHEVEVGSNMKGKDGKYPIFLEFGTKNMEPRPYLRPAFDHAKRLFYATIRKNVNNAIKKAR